MNCACVLSIGKKVGVAATNRLDDESLRRTAEQALEIARIQPENPEFHSLPTPQPITPALATMSVLPASRLRSVRVALA